MEDKRYWRGKVNVVRAICLIRWGEVRLIKKTSRIIKIQERGLISFLVPLTRAGLTLVKNVLTPLAKSVLIPLGSAAATSAADAAIQKKLHGSESTALIIPNEEMEDFVKTIKSLQEPALLIKGVSGTNENQGKELI